MGNLGSISIARLRKGMASASPFSCWVLTPMLNVFSASSDGVVADVELLDRRQRLSQLGSQAGGHLAESLDCIFLARGLGLLLGQRIPVATTHCLQADHILVAQTGNRTRQQRLTARPQADFLRHLASYALVSPTAHQS